MGDWDDENFAAFGNALEPLDEDNLPRKKPFTIEDQYALDQQGRRRFHGAFTGGFSAGYFNSVGTRDGWRPQQYKSSRSSKAGGVSQRPEDFMDEEDTGEFGIAPTGIRANSDFTDHSGRGTKRERLRRDNDGPIPGVPVLKELLKPVKDTVGVTLLKKMGWRPGQGIGPRVTKREKTKTRRKNEKTKIYGCSLPNQGEKIEYPDSSGSEDESAEVLFAPDDYEPFLCNPKDNYFGIGYTGLNRRPVLSGHVNLFEEPTLKLQDKNKKFSIRGQAFGVGAFEADDEDIYQRDDMSRYDFTLGPESNNSQSRWTKKDVETSKVDCLDGFQPATKELEKKKMFEAPELPRGFEPFHAVRKSRFNPPLEPLDRGTLEDARKKGFARHDLNAHSRAIIIGDSSPQMSLTEKSPTTEPKGSQVACNIIARTLNLHGKEQVEERRLQESQRSKNSSATWLEKLSAQSFVKGGVEGSDPSAAGSLKNLEDFKSNIAEASSSNEFSTPFVADTEKQKRFEKFLELTTNGEKEKLSSIQPLSMTEWEREHEQVEFDQMARLYERSNDTGEISKSDYLKKYGDESSSMSDKFVGIGADAPVPTEAESLNDRMKNAARMKMFGKLTRLREPWQPASLVCKRFNIPEPRTGCAKPDDRSKNKRFSVFDSLDVGSSERFERATDTAGTFKEPHIPYKSYERLSKGEKPARNDSSRIIDTFDIDASSSKSTEKIRSFEASYEKVFGRSHPIGATSSAMRDADKINEQETRELSNPPAPNTTNAEKNTAEKKDLFKAIFLSSSEDSETENDEDDSEAVKSLLIGKAPSEINAQRNTSPPRGIFAKLDLDSLTKPSKTDGRSKEIKSPREEKLSEKCVDSPENEAIAPLEVELPPDMYGPVLPAKGPKGDEILGKEEAPSTMDLGMQRPIFKSVVVPKTNTDDSERLKGKWVEKTKAKKSRKEKHKHKQKEKERSRHKHKSKKDKR